MEADVWFAKHLIKIAKNKKFDVAMMLVFL